MADKAVHARKHDVISGTAETALDTAKGAAKGIFQWGVGGIILGLSASALLGAGIAMLFGGGVIASVVGVAAGIASTPVTVPGATVLAAQVGALFGGVNGVSKGVERVSNESAAYKEAKTMEYAMGMQAQQANVQAQALQNLMVARAMQEQAMQEQRAAAARPSAKVAAAKAQKGTMLDPSQHVKDTVPGVAEAANDNDMEAMLKQLAAASEGSHADKAALDSQVAKEAAR